MRRDSRLALLAVVGAFSLVPGCTQQAPSDDPKPPSIALLPGPKTDPAGPGPKDVGGPQPKGEEPKSSWQPVQFEPAPNADQEKYEAALLEAFDLLGQKKYAEALTSLETAARFKDTELVQTEIKKLRLRIDQQRAAQRTLQDIQTVLDQGQVAEAGRLATAALQEFGATDVAPELVKVKLQADALAVAQLNDNAARHKAFRDQGEAALQVGNLRAASLAFEQALQFADDAPLRQRYDEIRGKLAKYDDDRQRAAELRKDP